MEEERFLYLSQEQEDMYENIGSLNHYSNEEWENFLEYFEYPEDEQEKITWQDSWLAYVDGSMSTAMSTQDNEMIDKNVYLIREDSDRVVHYTKINSYEDESVELLDSYYLEMLDKEESYQNNYDQMIDVEVSEIRETNPKGFPTIIVSEANIDSAVLSGLLEGKLTEYSGEALDLINQLHDSGSTRLFDVKNLLID